MVVSGLQSPLAHRELLWIPSRSLSVLSCDHSKGCLLLLFSSPPFLLAFCWESLRALLCFLQCCWRHCQSVCLRLHLPVSSSIPRKVLSEYVVHSPVASGLLLLLSVVCAFCGPVAGYAHHELFQILAAPLAPSFYVLQPEMLLCCLACVLVCFQQGRLAHYTSICFS